METTNAKKFKTKQTNNLSKLKFGLFYRLCRRIKLQRHVLRNTKCLVFANLIKYFCNLRKDEVLISMEPEFLITL